MSHAVNALPQISETLFSQFLPDLVQLLDLEFAATLDLTTPTFVRSETFDGEPRGQRVEADLVAEARTREGEPRLVLVHLETAGRFRDSMDRRTWRYSMHLLLKYGRPVISIVFLAGVAAGGRGELPAHPAFLRGLPSRALYGLAASTSSPARSAHGVSFPLAARPSSFAGLGADRSGDPPGLSASVDKRSGDPPGGFASVEKRPGDPPGGFASIGKRSGDSPGHFASIRKRSGDSPGYFATSFSAICRRK